MKPQRNIITAILSKLYGKITSGRNWLFDKGVLKSHTFDIPVISVGNLAVGGTGKTPHIEYLIRLLCKEFHIAVLSRGYKRSTKGFIIADAQSSALSIGDEPYQIYSKFPQIKVAVDEKRVDGIKHLMTKFPDLDAILLDDAYQHRYVKPGLSILLTDISNPYSDDKVLPYGYLREKPSNNDRADIVIVTKCEINVTIKEKEQWLERLNIQPHQSLFFSTFTYGSIFPLDNREQFIPNIDEATTVLIITGIEKPEPMIKYIAEKKAKIIKRIFPDHHQFTRSELNKIEISFKEILGEKLIITTEKDAARLESNSYFSDEIKKCIFVLPISVQIMNGEQEMFNKKIIDYVRKNSTNS